ncbi:MAG TPA: MAC/perforin domain-containing protein [Candidatus Dormibacteraeota bacterium]|jgi:hypothetical protein|nr:MAC/perforin domain-containing protein [Candidatus Dormibacteraeota bacterium]
MIIPGVTSLGRGFDIFGRVSNQDALLNPLIEMRSTDRTETVDGIEFEIPVYANVDRNSSTDGKANFFSSRRKFESHFAAEANIEASYGLFSAEFSAAYTSDRKVEESRSFALYDVKDTRYTLSLADASVNQVKEDIRQGFEQLPDVFTRENSETFWRFFGKYGTHFTTQVELGGRLFYYASISKSYISDEATANAKLTAEYKGVFSGKAEASAAWRQIDEKWMENREVHLKVAGGNSNILGSLVPTREVNKGDLFTEWLQSIRKDPAVMRFKLRPISDLVPERKMRALDDAFQSFVTAKVSAHSESNQAWSANSNIFVMGRPMMPPEAIENLPSLQIAVLDSLSLHPLHNKRWYIRVVPDRWGAPRNDLNIRAFNEVYQKIWEALNTYQQSSHIVLVAASNMVGWAVPTSSLALFLQSSGAGKQLELWQSFSRGTSDPAGINYALIGRVGVGPNEGFEHLEFSRRGGGAVRWPEDVTLNARLIPMRQGGRIRFQPVGGNREIVNLQSV